MRGQEGENMDLITIFYMANATLLLLHEMESAYEREWELLRLPGKITAFLALHIPIILLILYGMMEIGKKSFPGLISGAVLGIGGIIPVVVHKLLMKKEGHFDRPLSNLIIYLNVLMGLGLLISVIGGYA